MANSSQGGINSVEHALELLVLLGQNESVGVSQVAQALDIAPSSSHRLLNTFCSSGFAVRGVDRRYGRGPAFFRLSEANHPTHETLRKLLTPYLEDMTKEMQETSHLAVLEGPYVRFLNSVEVNRPLRVSSRAGRLLPAHKTSCGKALLGELSDTEVFEIYRNSDASFAKDVLSNFDVFQKKLQQTRNHGFGYNNGESETGIVAISVCVRPRSGKGLATLTVSMPTVRLNRANTPKWASRVKAYANRAAISLGITS